MITGRCVFRFDYRLAIFRFQLGVFLQPGSRDFTYKVTGLVRLGRPIGLSVWAPNMICAVEFRQRRLESVSHLSTEIFGHAPMTW